MDGSLALHEGILYVGRYAKTALVDSYDLDGHRLETHFEFRDPGVGRSAVSGLDVDADHRVWIADGPAHVLRTFTLFGREVATVEGSEDDRSGDIGAPVDVLARGEDDDLTLTVASAGRRRHALQELHPASGQSHSLRPEGDPEGCFGEIQDLAHEGHNLFVCERRGARIQVFRGGFFHYALELPGPDRGSDRFPSALAPVGDGRLVVAVGGEDASLLLLDAAGRLLRVLAEGGVEEGQVLEPCDLVLEPGHNDRESRIAVLDQAAERLQIFTLEGRCYGAFETLR